MNAYAQHDPVCLPPPEHKVDKCALKLLGLDPATLTDEEILEFISNYVQPCAIKALFYDTFNSFYVLHLSDIESTCLLIGKTLQMQTRQVNFLPLLDFFVIKNAYLSLTNDDLRDIFSAFGTVFNVANYRVLPNSSKFSHVLSGSREISFLLPGDDSEVYIPLNVMHPPYTFNVKHLCVKCKEQGHSLLNCPDIENDSDLLPSVLKCNGSCVFSVGDSDACNQVVCLKREDVSSDKMSNEKPMEDYSTSLKNMASNEDYSSSTSSDSAVLQRPSKILQLLSDSEKSSLSSSLDMIRASMVRWRRIDSSSETEAEDSDNNDDQKSLI